MPLVEGLVSRKMCQPHAAKRKRVTYAQALKWNEAEHPRNPAGSAAGGEFTSSGTGTGAPRAGQLFPRKPGAADVELVVRDTDTKLTPAQQAMQDELAKRDSQPVHKVQTPEEAVELILQGQNVEIQDTKDVHTVLKKLGEMAISASKLGSKAPNFDPCLITVKGTSLFCAEKIRTEKFPHGIPRIEMPQFKSKNPVPGSEADKLHRDSRGEVDATSVFMEHLAKEMGVTSFPNGKMLARKLKASQAEMEGVKVAGMMLSKRDPKKARITVSRDGYVVDGHHTWAAAVGRDAKDGNLDNDRRMEVVIINLPMSEIYHTAVAWTKKFGLPAVSVKKRALKFNPYHDGKGLFATKPGGTLAADSRPGLQKLIEQVHTPDGGFTVHPTTGEQPTTGFVVSIYKGRENVIPVDKLTPADLVRHVRANIDLLSQDGNFVGAWHNPEDHKVYLDVSRVESDRAVAQQLAETHNQIAYFDLQKGVSVYTKKVA